MSTTCPISSCANTHSIYIINVHLPSLPTLGSTSHVVWVNLLQYFIGTQQPHLYFLDMPYNINSDDVKAPAAFKSKFARALKNLTWYVLLPCLYVLTNIQF